MVNFESSNDEVVAKVGIDIDPATLASLREAINLTDALSTNLSMAAMAQKDFLQATRDSSDAMKAAKDAQADITEAMTSPDSPTSPLATHLGDQKTKHNQEAERDRANQERMQRENSEKAKKQHEENLKQSQYSDIERGSQFEKVLARRQGLESQDSQYLFQRAQQAGLIKEELSNTGDQMSRSFKGVSLDDVLDGDNPVVREQLLTQLAEHELSTDGNKAQQIKNLLSAGGNGLQSFVGRGAGSSGGMLSSASGIANAMKGSEALGALSKVGGVASGALGALTLANSTVQNVGEMYQGYKTQGLVRGGGAAEGFGYEMNARMIAMNPFINVEQARKMMTTGLNAGYNGESLDTLTEFMSKNFTDMGISIEDSMKMMQKNVREGGESITGLNMTLNNLKTSAKDADKSLPAMVQDFQNASGSAIDAGASGTAASEYGTVFAELFSDGENGTPHALASIGGDILSGASQNSTIARNVAKDLGFESTTTKGIQADIAENPKEALAAVWNQLIPYIKPFQDRIAKGASVADEMGRWNTRVNSLLRSNFSVGQTTELFNELKSGTNPVEEVNEKHEKKFEVTKNTGENYDDFIEGDDKTQIEKADYHVQAIQDLVDAGYNLDDMEVVLPNGKREKLDLNNKDQLDKLTSGEYNLAMKDDSQSEQEWFDANKEAYGLEDFDEMYDDDMFSTEQEDKAFEKMRADYKAQAEKGASLDSWATQGTSAISGGGGGGVYGTLQVELSDEAKKLIKSDGTVNLKPTKTDSNAGVPGATDAGTPPSEGE